MNEKKASEPIVNDPPIGNPGRDELNAEMSKAIRSMAPHVSRGARAALVAAFQAGDSVKPVSSAGTLVYLNASIEHAIAQEYPPEEIERMRSALEHYKKRAGLAGGSRPAT